MRRQSCGFGQDTFAKTEKEAVETAPEQLESEQQNNNVDTLEEMLLFANKANSAFHPRQSCEQLPPPRGMQLSERLHAFLITSCRGCTILTLRGWFVKQSRGEVRADGPYIPP